MKTNALRCCSLSKADGELKQAATRTCADYAGALRLLRKRPQDAPGFPKAALVSAAEETGLHEAWVEMLALADWRKENGHWDSRRAAQARHWFVQEVREGLLARLNSDAGQNLMRSYGIAVENGDMAAGAAAAKLLDELQ